MLTASGYHRFTAALSLMVPLIAAPCAAETAEDEPTIESLLRSGWQIAGYTGAVDNWSSVPASGYLVQCRTGYDATREPHIKPHCYKLR